MTTYAFRDSATMLRRNLLHAKRYPSMTISMVVTPVILLLLFRYVFGGALGNGIGGGGNYVNFLAPGIILMAAISCCVTTAVAVCSDMTEGVISRFRTMAISRASVLTGHVIGGLIQTMVCVVVVVGVSLAVGFRPSASPLDWLAVLGLIALLVFALTWLSVGFGLIAKNVESASNLPMPIVFLPFIGNAIVPAGSMPGWLRWFAEYQPFTPIINSVRGLLLGNPIGHDWILAIGWSLLIALVGYLWAKKLYAREPSR